MAYKSTYHEDSDADDEFERTVFEGPNVPQDLSPTDSEMTSPEHTPTTFTHSHSGGSHGSPTGLITQWTAEQTADFLSSLGLGQYADSIIDEAINGEALIEMQHQELKEMGMTSVGHRLTLLKAVYDTKVKQNIPLDPEHYVPLSAEGNATDQAATQDDIARVIESIRLRDQRIIQAEAELRAMKEDLHRIAEENRKLREETLPIIRMAKDRSHPLPNPEQPLTTPPPDLKPQTMGSSLSRKFSTKKLFLSGAPKNPSPTIHESRPLQDSTTLDPSAAAMAATSHLTASMNSQPSPNTVQQLSPTSPAYSQQASSAGSRTFPRTDGSSSARSNYQPSHDEAHHPYNSWTSNASQASTITSQAPRRTAPTPAPDTADPPLSAPLPSSSSTGTPSHRDRDRDRDRSERERDRDRDRDLSNPSVEIFKSFRVSIEDPCHKVLPVALKRYNIADDWRQYALYIVYGDQERCLGLEEKPLMLFKQLDREGKKPMFMLRKHASPAGEGWSGSAGGAGQGERGGGGLPGGVL